MENKNRFKKGTILHRLVEKKPDTNPLFTAFNHLKKDEDITKFYKEYLAWFMKDLGKKEGTRIARSNVGYVAGYFSDTTRKRWYRLLNVKHPVFGDF